VLVTARAAVIVTGSEVLGGRVSDRNGPWLSAQLADLGVDPVSVTIVGDRPADILAALEQCAALRVSLIVPSGGLGPTADDLTAAVVAPFAGREMALDAALEQRIAAILSARGRPPDVPATAAANRKQAIVPVGASVLEPVGTAPGLVVTDATARGRPTVVVLPGPPRELQQMWPAACATAAFAAATVARAPRQQRTLRLYGPPESQIAETLRAAESVGVDLVALEVTTCQRRGEIEIVTRYLPEGEASYLAFEAVVRERHGVSLFSADGATVDEQVASLAREGRRTIAVAESCTGGLLAGRLSAPAGASAYLLGGVVAYSNDVKESAVGVPAATLAEHGAVSGETAAALAEGVSERLRSDIGVGVTGIAGPTGGSADKPVGLVWVAVSAAGRPPVVQRAVFAGDRGEVRDRTTTFAMHLLRGVLLGEDPRQAA
jgi:nicotinamide-nucleotide amidase